MENYCSKENNLSLACEPIYQSASSDNKESENLSTLTSKKDVPSIQAQPNHSNSNNESHNEIGSVPSGLSSSLSYQANNYSYNNGPGLSNGCIPAGPLSTTHYYSPILNNSQTLLRPLMTTQPPLYSPILASQQHPYATLPHPSPSSSDVIRGIESLTCSAESIFKDVSQQSQANVDNSDKPCDGIASKQPVTSSDVNHKKTNSSNSHPSRFPSCAELAAKSNHFHDQQLMFEEYMRMYSDEVNARSLGDGNTTHSSNPALSQSSSMYRSNSYGSHQSGRGLNIHSYSDCRLDSTWNRYIPGQSSSNGNTEAVQNDSNLSSNSKPSGKGYNSSLNNSNYANNSQISEHNLTRTAYEYQAMSAGQLASFLTYVPAVNYQHSQDTRVVGSRSSQVGQTQCELSSDEVPSGISGDILKKSISTQCSHLDSTSSTSQEISVSHTSENHTISHSISSQDGTTSSGTNAPTTYTNNQQCVEKSGKDNSKNSIESSGKIHTQNAGSCSTISLDKLSSKNVAVKVSEESSKKQTPKELNCGEASGGGNFCLFCYSTVNGSSSHCSIDNLTTGSSKVSVSDKVAMLIGYPLPRDVLPSASVCPKCFHLINEVDVLEHRLKVCRREVNLLIETMFQRNGIHYSPYKRFQRQQYVGSYQHHEMHNAAYQHFGTNGMVSQNYNNCHPYQSDSQNYPSFNHIYPMYNHNNQNYVMHSNQMHQIQSYPENANQHHSATHDPNHGNTIHRAHHQQHLPHSIDHNMHGNVADNHHQHHTHQEDHSSHHQMSREQSTAAADDQVKNQIDHLTLKRPEENNLKQLQPSTHITQQAHSNNTCTIHQHQQSSHQLSQPGSSNDSLSHHSHSQDLNQHINKSVSNSYYSVSSRENISNLSMGVREKTSYSMESDSLSHRITCSEDHSHIAKSTHENRTELSAVSKYTECNTSCQSSSNVKDLSVPPTEDNLTQCLPQTSMAVNLESKKEVKLDNQSVEGLNLEENNHLALVLPENNEHFILPHSMSALFSYHHPNERINSELLANNFSESYSSDETAQSEVSLDKDFQEPGKIMSSVEKELLSFTDQQINTEAWNQCTDTVAKISNETKLTSVTLPECDIDIEECDNLIESVSEVHNQESPSLGCRSENVKHEGSVSDQSRVPGTIETDVNELNFDGGVHLPDSNQLIPVTSSSNELTTFLPSPQSVEPLESLRNVQNATEYHKPTLLGKKNIKGKKHAKLQICRQCDQVFSNRQALIRHIERRHKNIATSYACETCHKKFSTERNLKQHLQSHKTFSCKICGKIFLKKMKLKKHMEEHNKDNLICKICGKQTASTQALISHFKTHAVVTREEFVCNVCSKKFTCKRNLLHHSRIHTGEKPFSCGNCGKIFRNRSNMTHHHGICVGKFSFVCATCCKGFVLKSLYERHIGEHEGKFAHTCSICHKGFHKPSDLRYHFNTHPVAGQPSANQCSTCSSHGSSGCYMKKDNKAQACEICGKHIGSKKAMKDHLSFHSGKRSYSCQHCSLSYFYKCNLNFHIKSVHLQKRPYSCTICRKTFSKFGNYKLHMRTHTGEKPYQCQVCGKSFISSTNYKRHLKCHINPATIEEQIDDIGLL